MLLNIKPLILISQMKVWHSIIKYAKLLAKLLSKIKLSTIFNAIASQNTFILKSFRNQLSFRINITSIMTLSLYKISFIKTFQIPKMVEMNSYKPHLSINVLSSTWSSLMLSNVSKRVAISIMILSLRISWWT